jgi:hypothetical protein
LLIIVMFVFQLIAPAATAAASMIGGHEHPLEMADPASKCPMQLQELDLGGHDDADLDATHKGSAHCMTSCCFHDTVSSFKLVTRGALLPGMQWIDRGTTASSNADSTQERPPREI